MNFGKPSSCLRNNVLNLQLFKCILQFHCLCTVIWHSWMRLWVKHPPFPFWTIYIWTYCLHWIPLLCHLRIPKMQKEQWKMCGFSWENSARGNWCAKRDSCLPREKQSQHRDIQIKADSLGNSVSSPSADRQLLHQSVSNLCSWFLIQQVDMKAEGCFCVHCPQQDPGKEECRGNGRRIGEMS